ncbi:MAG TPA: type II toxin-antitoxin system death-on-curing family toxin [Candidatus Xenobia bacterium]
MKSGEFPEEIAFLDVELVKEIHRDQLLRYTEKPEMGIRDEALLESAVMACRAGNDEQYYCEDLFEMAASLMCSIDGNQAFLDGNKRTAAAAALTFLERNGIFLDEGDDLYNLCIRVSRKEISRVEVAEQLRKWPQIREEGPADYEN